VRESILLRTALDDAGAQDLASKESRGNASGTAIPADRQALPPGSPRVLSAVVAEPSHMVKCIGRSHGVARNLLTAESDP